MIEKIFGNQLTLTDYLAIYGALLSTGLAVVSIGMAVWQVLRHRRRVDISFHPTILPADPGPGIEYGLAVKFVNKGIRPVTIENAQVIMSQNIAMISTRGWGYKGIGALDGKKRLEDGDTFDLIITRSTLQQKIGDQYQETGDIILPEKLSFGISGRQREVKFPLEIIEYWIHGDIKDSLVGHLPTDFERGEEGPFEVTSFDFGSGPRACIRTPIEETEFPNELLERMIYYVQQLLPPYRQRVSAVVNKGLTASVKFLNTAGQSVIVDPVEEPDLIGLAFMITLDGIMYAYFVPVVSPVAN